jgi:LacI family transcriptional regulator
MTMSRHDNKAVSGGSSRPATLTDVAAAAGVSKMAVSAVLNHGGVGGSGGSRSTVRVSAATRERILAAARALDYRPNAIARALSRRATNLIGFYSEWPVNARNEFDAEIIGGLQHGCDDAGHNLLLYRSRQQHGPEQIESLVADMTSGTIDGLILRSAPSDPLVSRLCDSRLPVVAVGDPHPEIPTVLVDDAAGGRLQAQCLIARGCRRVLYRSLKGAYTGAIRRESFSEAATAAGITVLEDPEAVSDFLTPLEKRFLALPPEERPDGIACWVDSAARVTLRELNEAGLRIPEDIALIGFNGIEPAHSPSRRLTTIRAPWEQVARTAVELLVRRISGETIPMVTVLPVELAGGDTA